MIGKREGENLVWHRITKNPTQLYLGSTPFPVKLKMLIIVVLLDSLIGKIEWAYLVWYSITINPTTQLFLGSHVLHFNSLIPWFAK
jgi:hypothetical protein